MKHALLVSNSKQWDGSGIGTGKNPVDVSRHDFYVP